ncbi:MAG TPA: class I SAM-dependent methyltransferase [Candidatus Dormibacteraeota bacterium]|nr:class I SAM-dependent methyltransferase [Candidatus Dormibacteraeota bacterium]
MSGTVRTEYDPSYFEPLAAVEDHHFWFRARNRVIAATVGQLTATLAPGYRVLEVGCGTGNVLRTLAAACPTGSVMGIDLFQDGLEVARRRLPNAALVRADAMHPPFSVRFEIVGMFDVLEHLPDDVGVLHALRQMITDGGALVVTVPAGPRLWSYFDEAAQHVRRYTSDELAGKLAQAGFEIEFLSPYMAGLYPALWAGRRLAPRRSGSANLSEPDRRKRLVDQELNLNPLLGAAFRPLLALERPLLRRRRKLPIGSSLIAVARRSGRDAD